MTAHPATAAFVAAFARGLLCLHPTDTLVGLTSNSYASLCTYKQRPRQHAFVHLAADCVSAWRYWQPLPAGWQARLHQTWPAPLTVVWHAADPASPGTQDGMLAIRVPRLLPQHRWFAACLRELQLIPSTSVNYHREPPLTLAAAVARGRGDVRVHVPEPLLHVPPSRPDTPSTLIRLHDDGSWELLRQGGFVVSRTAFEAR